MTIFKNSLIEIEFLFHKSHPFLVHNPMVFCFVFCFCKFTELYNHHHNLILEHFYHPPKETLNPLAAAFHCLYNHPSHPQTSSILVSFSVIFYPNELPIQKISYKWSPTNMTFGNWLPSFSIMFSRCTHIAAYTST